MVHRGVTIASALLHQPDQPMATSRDRTWRGVTVDCHQANKQYYLAAPPLDHHAVIYFSAGIGKMRQVRGGQSFQGTISPGSSSVVPAGLACVWEGSSPFNIRIRINKELLRSAADEFKGSIPKTGELQSVFLTRDDSIRLYAELFNAELAMPEHPAQALLIESASCAFAVHLLRAYDTSGVRDTGFRHGLSPKRIALVTNYMNDNLESPIRLSKLATLAQVSRFHVGRMFKVNMGMSPMTYLEHVRIEHAKRLLQSKPFSLYDVALSCGFADQSYFAKRFARHVCCTPSEYRRRHSSCTPVVQDFRRTDMRSTKVSMSHQAHYLTNTARSSA